MVSPMGNDELAAELIERFDPYEETHPRHPKLRG